MLFRIGKILILGFLGFLLWGALKRELDSPEKSFFQMGREVIGAWLEREMLFGQSVELGLLGEGSTVFAVSESKRKWESPLPFSTNISAIVMGEEDSKRLWEENQMTKMENQEEILIKFVPQTEKQMELDWKNYQSLESLKQAFYAVDPTTSMEESLFQIDSLVHTDMTTEKNTEEPRILLYHTHSQETFADSEAGKEEDSILGAGDVLAELLENYGYTVLHHKGKYDVKSRDYAYSESLPAIEKLLEENPSIEVIIDLHRDAVAEDTKLVTKLQGKDTAKVMFFNGLSRSTQGAIDYLENPYLQENLAFAFQMKAVCDQYYPGFARSIYLRAYRYNMHLRPKTLLIELGAQTNTVEEIHNALYPLVHALDMVLSGNVD